MKNEKRRTLGPLEVAVDVALEAGVADAIVEGGCDPLSGSTEGGRGAAPGGGGWGIPKEGAAAAALDVGRRCVGAVGPPGMGAGGKPGKPGARKNMDSGPPPIFGTFFNWKGISREMYIYKFRLANWTVTTSYEKLFLVT